MWQTFLQPTSLEEALALAETYGAEARILAGGTDILVELQRGVKPTRTLIDLSAVTGLRYVELDGSWLRIGALATHNDILKAPCCWQYALPLAQACQEIGAPQIRARATVAGNLLTASPANDTIAPLLALDAVLVLQSASGERVLPLSQFYHGVRRTALLPGELLREIRVPALTASSRGLFLKLGLRRAQAISVVNVALVLTWVGDLVSEARVTLGCVAPTVTRALHVEAFLQGKRLDSQVCWQAACLVEQDCAPIDDVRASAAYRLLTLTHLLASGLERLASPAPVSVQPASPPVLLETARPQPTRPVSPLSELADDAIQVTLNGQERQFAHVRQKTLLHLLREDAGLTGCKEGCAEGECGACTVWLNGCAVMSCLVPAAQAHGATVTTIEYRMPTLAAGDTRASSAVVIPVAGETSQSAADMPVQAGEGRYLQALQQAFIDCAAVQCGFCIPGMLMAGAKLLEEYPHPSLAQMRSALSGNLCRCTGYRKILDALAQVGGDEHV